MMLNHTLAFLMTWVVIGCLLVGSAFAAPPGVEAYASVNGTVTDASGDVVIGVKITAINDRMGIQRYAVTNDEGRFVIPLLPPGTYTLTAEMRGFATMMITNLEAQAGIDRKIIIVLQPKGVAEMIRIEAGQQGINFSDATLKYSITGEQVQQQPIISTYQGRNVLDTIPFLIPGVLPGFDYGVRGEGLSINGARPLANVFTIDGGDNNDYELNKAASPFPNPDALEAVTILTSNYKADTGGGAGGILNAVTKSGSDQLHGNVRYFFGAGGYTGLRSLGGQLGGPVVVPRFYNGKTRTHFFFDYEGYRTGGQGLYPLQVLSMKERAGDFSDLPPFNPDDPFILHQPVDPLTGQSFPGGKIPANRIDPIARFYLDHFIPPPNAGERTFRTTLPGENHNRQATLRLDHQIGQADSLTGTYLYDDTTGKGPFGSALPIGTTLNRSVNHSFTIRESRTFSATTVNQLTGTVSHYVELYTPRYPGFIGVDPQAAGFTGVHAQSNKYLSLPSVTIFGMSSDVSTTVVNVGFGNAFFLGDRTKITLALRDDFTQVRGTHTLTFGGGVRTFMFDKFVPSNNGHFSFEDSNPLGTGSGVADFLLGSPDSYQQNTGNTQRQRQWAYSFYGMDDWKLRPNLTVNLGLRYELTPPVTDKLDQVTVFRRGQQSTQFPQLPPGMLTVGDPDPFLGTVPRGGYLTDKNNLAPRLGIAYSPAAKRGWLHALLGDARTSIRAGFGVFYSATYGAHLSQYAVQSPFSYTAYLATQPIFGRPQVGSFANPFGASPNPFPLSADHTPTDIFPFIHTFDPAFRSAYTYHYNFGIQRELPWSMLLELSYVGSDSFKLDRERELDPVALDRGNLNLFILDYLSVLSQESSGRARYDSLQARLSRRFRGGLQFDGSYVFSKALDNASGPRISETGSNYISGLRDDKPHRTSLSSWARSAFDRQHSFVVSYTYDLAIKKLEGISGYLINGWRVGGFTRLVAGAPMDISSNSGRSFYSSLTARPDIVGPYRRLDPRQEQTFVVNGKAVTGYFFFDPTVFRLAPASREGTLGRNVFDGPSLSYTSISVAKRTPLYKSHEAEFRVDILNLFKQLNFAEPNLSLGTEFFGQVSNYSTYRAIQLSLRYRF